MPTTYKNGKMAGKSLQTTRKPGQPAPTRQTDRGQPTRPAQSTRAKPDNPGQPPAKPAPPHIGPIFETTRPNIGGANQPTGGQPPTDQPTPPDQITGINRGKTTRPNQPKRPNKRPANGPIN